MLNHSLPVTSAVESFDALMLVGGLSLLPHDPNNPPPPSPIDPVIHDAPNLSSVQGPVTPDP